MKLGWHTRGFAAAVVGALFANGCGSSSSNGSGANSADIPSRQGFGGASEGVGGPGFGGSAGTGFSESDGGALIGPEQKNPISFQLPQAGQNYVYVANPSGDTVAVIDAKTLAIQTVPAGAEPQFLQTLDGKDAAIVLNVGSNDATIIRTANGTSTTTTVSVQPGSNSIAVAPDGKHAVAYFNAALSTGNQLGSFQDVTTISLGPDGDTSTPTTVGFQPSNVFFSSDGTSAFIVTQNGVSILTFSNLPADAGAPARTVPLDSSLTDESSLDVSVTPDGKYALARADGTSVLRLVELATGTIQTLDVAKLPGVIAADAGAPDAGAAAPDGGDAGGRSSSSPPPTAVPAPAAITDLELASSGAYAMAVVRDRSAAVQIPIPDAFGDPSRATTTVVPGEVIGSATLSPGGHYALLYTTADPTNKHLTLLDLTGATPIRTIELEKSIQSIAVAPGDGTALVVHRKIDDRDPSEPGIDLATRLDREYGYSVVALATGFPKLEVTAAPLGPFATVPDGSHLFILFNACMPTAVGGCSAGTQDVDDVDLRSLLIDSIPLGSPPISVGAVPASNRVFVGQDHPDGRISFIDWTNGQIQSVTGFELNGQIRQ